MELDVAPSDVGVGVRFNSWGKNVLPGSATATLCLRCAFCHYRDSLVRLETWNLAVR